MTSTKNWNKEHIEEGTRLVKAIQNKIITAYNLLSYMCREELEDMQQEGMLEMLKVAKKYDKSYNAKFTTYLLPRITGFFQDYIEQYNKQKEQERRIDAPNFYTNIERVLSFDKTQAVMHLQTLNLSQTQMKDLMVNVSDVENTHEVIDILCTLPDSAIYLLLSHYMLEKSMKEIGDEFGFTPDSNRTYQIRKKILKKIKTILEEKKE